MSLQIASPFEQFFDRDGSPLDNGFVYIGTANLNPETNPLTIFFDDALTIPAAQPLRTSNGYIVRNGSPARLFTSQEDFSLTVREKNGVLVFTVADAASALNLSTQFAQFVSDLADGSGSSLVGYNQGDAGAIDRTVEDRLRDRVSAADFGAVGNGVTDDTVALQAALDAAAGGVLFVPQGQYIVSETLYIPAGTAVCGEGKYSLWTNDAQGTEFITTGAGNAQRWTDIDGSDPADDTPLFVAQGDGVYLDSVALLTGEGGQPAWSMGVLFPCVKQCGFSRLVANGFTDGCVYLDATWSDRNTTLINLHPEITPSAGMNEFAGIDFYLRGGGTAGFGIKIQGTTRLGTSVPTANDWLWGFGGTSDIRFTEGRLGGTGINGGCFRHDVQLFGANAFGQGVTLHNVSFRLFGSGTYFLDLDRTNRLIVDSAYGETVGTEVPQISVTSRTQSSVDGIIRINDKLNGTVFLDGVSTGTSGSNVPWAATRCIVTHRADGRLFTPSITGNFGSSNPLFLRSFAVNGQMRLTHDDGTTGTNFLLIQNNVIRPEVASSINLGTGGFPFGGVSCGLVISQQVRPNADDTFPLGSALFRWTELFAASGTINTSDAREKQDVEELSEAERRVAVAIKGLIRKFRWKSAVTKKGDAARWHFGVMAQDVIAAFDAEGLDAMRYGLVCYDEWADQFDDDGNLTAPAGNRFGVRYDELLAFVLGAM